VWACRANRRRGGEAARLAGERLVAKGMPALPHTTPHTLRRTYISIALIANRFDVKFVMSQVGHADSAMTMDVYAQLEQRAKRSHGTSFDRLLAEAREQVDSPRPTGAPAREELEEREERSAPGRRSSGSRAPPIRCVARGEVAQFGRALD
jgi:Phage integrase family